MLIPLVPGSIEKVLVPVPSVVVKVSEFRAKPYVVVMFEPPEITIYLFTTIVVVVSPKAVTESVAVTVSIYVPSAVELSTVITPVAEFIDMPETLGEMLKIIALDPPLAPVTVPPVVLKAVEDRATPFVVVTAEPFVRAMAELIWTVKAL